MIEDVFVRILEVGFGACLLIASVCVIRFFLRSSPAWMMRVLWAFVALRLLLPFYVEVPYGHEWEEGTAAFEQLAPERMSELVYGEQRVSPKEREATPKAESAQADGEEKVDFSHVAPYLWILVGASVLSAGIVRYSLLKRKVRFAYPTDDGVFEAEGIGNSFVFGIIRPRIYLPSGLREPMRSHVIAHERAHISHGDHLIKALAYLLLSVYWFNPLMWAAFVLLCRDIEFQCDRSVVRGMDQQGQRAYALSLVKIGTGRAKVARRIMTISPIHFGEVGLSGRVRSILKFSRKIKWTMIVAGVLAIGLATLLFASSFTASAVADKQLYKNTENIYLLTSTCRLVSVNVQSGQMNYLCTDADCPHTVDVCEYVADEEGFGIYVTDSHVFYVRESKGGGMWRFALWQYDMESGEASCVYDENTRINTLSHYENYLFFNSARHVDTQEEDGSTVGKDVYDLYRYDMKSGKVRQMNDETLAGEQYLDGVQDGAYCWTQMGEQNECYVTDNNYKNRQIPENIGDYAPYHTGNECYRLISKRIGDLWIDGMWTLEREDAESGNAEEFIPRCGSYRVMGDKVVYLLPLEEPVKIGEYVNERTGETVPVYDYYEDCICIRDLNTGELTCVDYAPEELGGSVINLYGPGTLDDRYLCVFARTLKENATYADYEVSGQYVFDMETGEFTVIG